MAIEITMRILKQNGGRRPRCQCEVTQYREFRNSVMCKNLANWDVEGTAMCGTHAQSLLWQRALRENGYDSDGVLIPVGEL